MIAAFDFYKMVQIFPESDEITPFPDCGRVLWVEHKGAIIGPYFRQHHPLHSLTLSLYLHMVTYGDNNDDPYFTMANYLCQHHLLHSLTQSVLLWIVSGVNNDDPT